MVEHLVSSIMIMHWHLCRRDAGGAHPVWRVLRVSRGHCVWPLLGGAAVWHHQLWQHWPVHVDSLPVHHSRGMDRHALLGSWLPRKNLAVVLLCHHGCSWFLLCHESHSWCALWRVFQGKRKVPVPWWLSEVESETTNGGGFAGLHGLDIKGNTNLYFCNIKTIIIFRRKT